MRHTPQNRWGYVFVEDAGESAVRDWLIDLPSKVRQQLLDTLDAVLTTREPTRAYLPNRWHSMRDAEGVDMGDYHEARDQHRGTNYRLICRFDSAADALLGSPVLVLLHGASKPDRTALPSREYVAATQAWQRYRGEPRRCSPVSFPPVGLPLGP